MANSEDVGLMLDAMGLLRADIAELRSESGTLRRALGEVEAKTEGLETWRGFYLEQETHVVAKVFSRIDEVFALVGSLRAELSRIAGERDAERRITMTAISVLSAATGALIAHYLHGAG